MNELCKLASPNSNKCNVKEEYHDGNSSLEGLCRTLDVLFRFQVKKSILIMIIMLIDIYGH